MDISLTDLQHTYSGKSTEELLSLHTRGTLTETAYEVLEAELSRRSVAVPPRAGLEKELAAAKESYRRMRLSAHWKGEAPLASAYWLIGVLGFWVAYGVFLLASHLSRVLSAAALVLLLAVMVFAWVSIWRCWNNSSWRGWGYIARAIVVIDVITVVAVAISVIYQVRALD